MIFEEKTINRFVSKKALVLISFLIFFVSALVYYWPIQHKGYSHAFETDTLILGRNLSRGLGYKMDSEKNVVLSSETVAERGIESRLGNKLTAVLYGKVFAVFGFDQELPFKVSVAVHALTGVLFFLLTLKLFNLSAALILALINLFLPLTAQFAIRPGGYEWAAFFVAVGLLFYLYKEKTKWPGVLLAGLFLALASLARNSFLFLAAPFLIYDWWKNRSLKRLLVFGLPFVFLWLAPLAFGLVKEGRTDNAYLGAEETTIAYMHLFPDPYTWHFEREAFIESVRGTTNYDYNQYLTQYGYSISLKNRVLMYLSSVKSYPKAVLDLTILGGPISVLFLILGAFYLRRNRKELWRLSWLWLGSIYLLLIASKTNHWGHLMVLQYPFLLLIALGLYGTAEFIFRQEFSTRNKKILTAGLMLAFSLHLAVADKWTFHDRYENSNIEQALALARTVGKNQNEINKQSDVVASGVKYGACEIINYYNDVSCVYFDPATVEKLLEQKKLKWAFEQFGVTKIIGFEAELVEKIVEMTGVEAF